MYFSVIILLASVVAGSEWNLPIRHRSVLIPTVQNFVRLNGRIGSQHTSNWDSRNVEFRSAIIEYPLTNIGRETANGHLRRNSQQGYESEGLLNSELLVKPAEPLVNTNERRFSPPETDVLEFSTYNPGTDKAKPIPEYIKIAQKFQRENQNTNQNYTPIKSEHNIPEKRENYVIHPELQQTTPVYMNAPKNSEFQESVQSSHNHNPHYSKEDKREKSPQTRPLPKYIEIAQKFGAGIQNGNHSRRSTDNKTTENPNKHRLNTNIASDTTNKEFTIPNNHRINHPHSNATYQNTNKSVVLPTPTKHTDYGSDSERANTDNENAKTNKNYSNTTPRTRTLANNTKSSDDEEMKSTEDDRWVWGETQNAVTNQISNTTETPATVTLADRANFTGDKCPNGMVKIMSKCVMPE